jgi:hypothetical protein
MSVELLAVARPAVDPNPVVVGANGMASIVPRNAQQARSIQLDKTRSIQGVETIMGTMEKN